MTRSEDQHGLAPAMTKRNLIFAAVTLLAAGLSFNSLKAWVDFSYHSDIYRFGFAVPAISLFLLYLERRRVFRSVRYEYGMGLLLISAALGIQMWAGFHANAEMFVTVATCSFIVLLAGTFTLSYGLRSLYAGAFMFLLLIFIVPLPTLVLDKAVYVLRNYSAHAAALIFRLGGIPYFRTGFRFLLPSSAVTRSAFPMIVWASARLRTHSSSTSSRAATGS